jgi:hypothetical protein
MNTVHIYVCKLLQCAASFNINQTILKLNYFKNLVASTVCFLLSNFVSCKIKFRASRKQY